MLIPLVLLLFGTIQFGLALHRQQGMEAAAREGVRIAAVGGTVDDVEARVSTALPASINPAHVEVTVETAGAPGLCSLNAVNNNSEVEVVIQIVAGERARYQVSIPFFGSRDFAFESKGVFRCERAAPPTP